MKNMMKSIAAGLLAMAAVIAAQMALTGVVGFRTAELLGKTAVTALYLYAVVRVCRAGREAKA